MRSLISFAFAIACITLCGASQYHQIPLSPHHHPTSYPPHHHPTSYPPHHRPTSYPPHHRPTSYPPHHRPTSHPHPPHHHRIPYSGDHEYLLNKDSGVPLFILNEGTGDLEFNRERLAVNPHTADYIYLAESKHEGETHHHHESTETYHQVPVLEHTKEKIDIPFHEADSIIVTESTEFEKNMELLETFKAQRNLINTQIEQIKLIQQADTGLRFEQSEVMTTLLRQREFLSFQINSLVSLLGLETKYSTQLQVVGPSLQVPQTQIIAEPEYVEKKILFSEPTALIHDIYPPQPVKAQTFHLTPIESHPSLLSALESQREMINIALHKLEENHTNEKSSLKEFYITRRDIITAQIEHIKELQREKFTTTTEKRVETTTYNPTTMTTTMAPERETMAPSTPKPVVKEGELLAVLTMIRDSLQQQIQLLLTRTETHQHMEKEDVDSLLKVLRAECDVIDLQIAGYSKTTSSKTVTSEKIVEHNEHILTPPFDAPRRYLPTY